MGTCISRVRARWLKREGSLENVLKSGRLKQESLDLGITHSYSQISLV